MLYVYPIHHDFKKGDKVVDVTAEENDLPDKNGEVVDVDGSHVKVLYESGNVRWKKHINLRHEQAA